MAKYHGKVVIIGLGVTGLSCVDFFLERGITPYIMDTRISPFGLNKLPEQVEYHLGGLDDKFLLTADLIVVSPGIALSHPFLSAAVEAGIEIVGDIELFCREAKAPIIAITGSNGKSTVTSLIGEMSQASGINTGIGGNIGLPALKILDSRKELYILELSSFQLETTYSLRANAATILNVSEDHMDRYPYGLQQYRKAKLRIYENSSICVINEDDILTTPVCRVDKRCISFGENKGDYRLQKIRKETWLHAKGENLLNVKEMPLIGKHNYINGLVAMALSDIIGLPRASSLKTLTTFSGLAHRFQLVLERNGIRWINDSKSTNLGSTTAALNSLNLAGFAGTLHLLLGGDSKLADLSSLKSKLMHNKTRIYCFGKDKEKLEMLCPEITKKTETLEQAIRLLLHRVKSGDIVLFSPACSSFDQFNNFEQRGSMFTYLAKKLG